MDKHNFVICAYQESPYLEECIRSLKNQTIQSPIKMVTSTPCVYIKTLAEKYNLPLYVNEGEGGIAQDWNFAMSQCDAKYITIAHQDDIYEPAYAEKIIGRLDQAERPLIAFSGYGELRNGQKIWASPLINIKKTMLLPMRIKEFSGSKFIRRRCMSLGNSICCPAVTYAMDNLQMPVFQVGLKSNLDWETWERISRERGEFLYIPEPLMLHRLHEESTTSQLINEHKRGGEDLEMFLKFWPSGIAHLINKFYARGEKYNGS